jgi:opacity protein-like surface antigen
MTNLLIRLIIVSLLIVTSYAQTQKQRKAPDASDNRFDFAVSYSLGVAHTLSSDLTISQPSLNTNLRFQDLEFRGRSFDKPLYYDIRASFFRHRKSWLGAEAEFIHLKVYSKPEQRVQAEGINQGVAINGQINLGDIVQRYSITHGVNLLLFNLAGRRVYSRNDSHPHGRLILIARAGAGFTIPHTESIINGVSQEQYERGRFAWQAAGGAEVHLWRGLFGVGEYKFTRTRQKGKVFSGEADSLLRSHHGVFGFSYHF